MEKKKYRLKCLKSKKIIGYYDTEEEMVLATESLKKWAMGERYNPETKEYDFFFIYF